ncbi:hypothetical protein WJX72_008188 [[Myrmecia] bisecta]|uniref:MORN repeat-containing protein 3 n=1 Tax=[Myrmecia] bisecta TaxID=41462 RepID=A0AAW1PHZ1_9CHLO
MAGAIAASITISGQEVHAISIPSQGQKASESVGKLKQETMQFLNEYMANHQLIADEVDLLEEAGCSGSRLQYEGEWFQGRREGQGSRWYHNGEVYTGQWQNNRRNGLGSMQYCNGDVYEGRWHDEQRQGPATYYYANGDIFMGSYAFDQREGLGTLYMPDRRKKFCAEYIAGKPMCGTWHGLEDHEMPRRQRSPSRPATTKAPAGQLPALDLKDPNQVLAEQITAVRQQRSLTAQVMRQVQKQQGTFNDIELQQLRNTFVMLASPPGHLAAGKLRRLAAAAGLDLASSRTARLLAAAEQNLDARGLVSYEDFLDAAVHMHDPLQSDTDDDSGMSDAETYVNDLNAST